ncbi:hypothetical protein KQX54_007362, partial [Cotesia glomerata]
PSSNNDYSDEEVVIVQNLKHASTSNDDWETQEHNEVLVPIPSISREPVPIELLSEQLVNLNNLDTSNNPVVGKFNDNFKNIIKNTMKQNIQYLLSDNNYEIHLSYPDDYVQDIVNVMEENNDTSNFKDLCNFGIKILQMHLTSQKKRKFYMNSLMNIIKKINKIIVQQNNINIPEKSNLDNALFRSLILLAMYEYMGYNNLNKLSTCHNAINSIIHNLDESVKMPFDKDIQFICLTIPILLTDYLYDRHKFDNEIKEAVGYLKETFEKVDNKNKFYYSLYEIFSNELNK